MRMYEKINGKNMKFWIQISEKSWREEDFCKKSLKKNVNILIRSLNLFANSGILV
jgi:hypothetical protein